METIDANDFHRLTGTSLTVAEYYVNASNGNLIISLNKYFDKHNDFMNLSSPKKTKKIKTTITPISTKKQTPTKINNNRIKKKKKILTPSEKRALQFRKEASILYLQEGDDMM